MRTHRAHCFTPHAPHITAPYARTASLAVAAEVQPVVCHPHSHFVICDVFTHSNMPLTNECKPHPSRLVCAHTHRCPSQCTTQVTTRAHVGHTAHSVSHGEEDGDADCDGNGDDLHVRAQETRKHTTKQSRSQTARPGTRRNADEQGEHRVIPSHMNSASLNPYTHAHGRIHALITSNTHQHHRAMVVVAHTALPSPPPPPIDRLFSSMHYCARRQNLLCSSHSHSSPPPRSLPIDRTTATMTE
jgi:hypothetical protein